MKANARLTVDMPAKEHTYLKMASAKLGISMREFVLLAAFEKMEEMEDDWFVKRARETLHRIETGAEKILSWDRVKKRLGDPHVRYRPRRKRRKVSN